VFYICEEQYNIISRKSVDYFCAPQPYDILLSNY